ncbi:7217_t:CDS:2, partial [Gigaspora rosea]
MVLGTRRRKVLKIEWVPLVYKSELVAILCTLLVVKSDSVVVVKTNSLVVISSIE